MRDHGCTLEHWTKVYYKKIKVFYKAVARMTNLLLYATLTLKQCSSNAMGLK